MPHWYQVTLDNGTQGFVSKAWSHVIPDPVAASDSIRLGGWNIKKLGHGNSTNFELVVGIIERNFDIVAVVEVMQRSAGAPATTSFCSVSAPAGRGW